ncbi:MAG: tyrosine-protein phosphatase [Sphingomonadales bacterium]|nr:MAG: tyrosine-protein phosphatase [Sphingomonadales bacterium]
MLESIVNFRDFGGLPSRFGGSVVRDRLFRSGAVATVSDDDATDLHKLDFSLVVDLRYAGEREEEPSPWPAAAIGRVLSHDGDHTAEAPHMAPLRQGVLDLEKSDRIYCQLYRDLPFDAHYPGLFDRALGSLLGADGRVLVHCSAGKDRTGIFVALIHHALGVSRADIMADYMKSRQAAGLHTMAEPAARKLSERFGVPISITLMRHLLDVKEVYLEGFFDEVERRCGSVDAYLDMLGMDEAARRALRDRLLTP